MLVIRLVVGETRGVSHRLLWYVIKVLAVPVPTEGRLIERSGCISSYHVHCLLPLSIGLLRSKVCLIILLLIRLHHSVRILLLSSSVLILIEASLVSLWLCLDVVHDSVPTVHCGRLFFWLSSRS